MANRNLYSSASSPPVTGGAYMDNVKEKIDILFNSIALKPTSITNSGNNYTIIVDPTLTSTVGEAMSFYIKPNATNTDTVDLRITSSGAYYNVTTADGSELAAGEWNTGTYYFVAFLDGAFRILSMFGDAEVTSVALYQAFTASGTWTKPAGLSNDAIVIVEVWGAGGGGGRSNGVGIGGGGGGGAYVRQDLRAGDLTSSVSVTVGTGGAGGAANNTPGGVGGTSSFGAYVQAFGGGGGGGNTGGSQAGGGGGGGATSAGQSAGVANATYQGGGPVFLQLGAISANSIPLCYGGTFGYNGATSSCGSAEKGGGAGAANISGSSAAGSSIFGGGGGAAGGGSAPSTTPGTSVYGGNGGAVGVAGSAPAGGGGQGAAGGRGEVRVRIIP